MGEISVLVLGVIRFLIDIAHIFQSFDSRIIDRKYSTGPFGFHGFWMKILIPCTISLGYFPVLEISFKISTISFGSVFVPNSSSSTLIPYLPAHLLFLS